MYEITRYNHGGYHTVYIMMPVTYE